MRHRQTRARSWPSRPSVQPEEKPALPLSLPTDQAFLWHQRLREQAAVRNITLVHVEIATRLYGLLEVGEDRITHARLAKDTRHGISTVQDALRRLRALGLIAWEQRYEMRGGLRRQAANAYRITIPAEPARPRPELRRRRPARGGGVHRPLSQQNYAQERVTVRPEIMLRASEARIMAAWQARRPVRMELCAVQ
jgi:hypothetical protein